MALTLNCKTNIKYKNGSGGDQLTDDRFQPTDGRFELVDEKSGAVFLAKFFLFRRNCITKKNSPKGLSDIFIKKIDDDQDRSFIEAPGAFFFTEAMPFSMAAVLEYISLAPMTCPLEALRLK